jgi:tetratricopeptide (TPR) repeat protein
LTAQRAGAAAARKGAPDSAVAYLERCLTEPPPPEERVEVLIQLGAIAQLVNLATAAEHLSAALTLTQQPQQRALIAEMLGFALFHVGRNDEAIAVYTQAEQTLAKTGEHAGLRRRLQASLINIALTDPSLLPLAAEWTNRLREEPPEESLGSRMLDCMIAGYDAYAGVPAEAAVARARRGLAGGHVLEQTNANSAFAHGCMVLMCADLDEVMPLLDASVARAYRRGSIFALAGTKCFRARAWFWRGFLVEAEADARDAIQAMQTARLSMGLPYAAIYLAEALMEQGRLAEAEAALDCVTLPSVRLQLGHWYWLLGRARLLTFQGRTEEGLKGTLACGRRLADHGWHNPALIPWRSTAAGEHPEPSGSRFAWQGSSRAANKVSGNSARQSRCSRLAQPG